MKILIAYATRYGTTEKCADILAKQLNEKGHEVDLVDLKKNKKVDPSEYDIVATGGSFVAFRMNSGVRKFVNRNLKTLLDMKTGVFMCGADEDWEKEIKKGFPEELLEKAVTKGYFGFEMNWDKMNPMVRGMMQKAYKSTDPVSKINEENINTFAEELTKP
jgi:menaquinone-dependent protoporphyrinogen oxidase